jgi:hypothetical protein
LQCHCHSVLKHTVLNIFFLSYVNCCGLTTTMTTLLTEAVEKKAVEVFCGNFGVFLPLLPIINAYLKALRFSPLPTASFMPSSILQSRDRREVKVPSSRSSFTAGATTLKIAFKGWRLLPRQRHCLILMVSGSCYWKHTMWDLIFNAKKLMLVQKKIE